MHLALLHVHRETKNSYLYGSIYVYLVNATTTYLATCVFTTTCHRKFKNNLDESGQSLQHSCVQQGTIFDLC